MNGDSKPEVVVEKVVIDEPEFKKSKIEFKSVKLIVNGQKSEGAVKVDAKQDSEQDSKPDSESKPDPEFKAFLSNISKTLEFPKNVLERWFKSISITPKEITPVFNGTKFRGFAIATLNTKS